ncbi:hypothetical protein NUU61_009059 [Penicillium alfredii]|uniref:Major facilitator superfamily (MFS) profile domain-containing protein n=1 Tax=Penicillium alfredii TaxID=1506179 RepID=A0A9W9JWW8_9EURO|nr:uncharacterized protein NUU61_009059 [Penicillium alfredii]KAJ5084480.1 hypothetical protein NUU61_009059 [Penicillium alfredii]
MHAAMQSFLQYRRICKQLKQQLVVKHESPDEAWTGERRYSYQGGRIQSEPREPDDGEPATRRREHGHRTRISGPTLQPRHTTATHLEPDGDVERADYDTQIQGDPQTINSAETLGDTPEMIVTGLERCRPEADDPNDVPDGTANGGGRKAQQDKVVVVTFEGDCDPMDPHNWPILCRFGCTVLVAFTASVILWASTIYSAALSSARWYYGTSFELQIVPTALYLIGVGIGGVVTAPLSEVVGRNPVYIPSLTLFILFTMGSALSQNIAQGIVCRAFAGFFGSAPLVCAGGSLVDLWSRIERIYAFPIYAILTFMGPIVSPTPGSFVTMAKAVNWRFVDWMTMIFAGVILTLVVLCLPETYSPVILHWKAKQLRLLTGDPRYRPPLEFKRVSFILRVAHALYRPFLLFVTEPIIMIFAVYLSIIFIILYTFVAGYVHIYKEIYHFNTGQTGLAFLGIAVGIWLAAPLVPLAMKLLRKDILRSRAEGKDRPGPEIGLYMAMFGAPAVPLALFWMGWTARASISVWFPLASSVLFGFGVICVFVSSYQYISDAFENHAASALASIQVFRFTAAGVMVVVSEKMYRHLGVAWTLSVFGALATVLLPVPYVLYRWGPVVRRWSRYARSEG